jgi:hypothetical protein
VSFTILLLSPAVTAVTVTAVTVTAVTVTAVTVTVYLIPGGRGWGSGFTGL